MPIKPQTISVYITSYNQPEYLALALESVLTQTRKPDQIVIIDDASTDSSQDLIRSYQQQHQGLITPVFNETNQGIAESRKRAIQATTGDLISSLDGDDLYLPNKLQLQEQALLDNPKAGYAYSNFAFIDESGTQTGVWYDDDTLPSGDLFEHVACRRFPSNACHRNELIRREALLGAMDYEHGKNLFEDFDTLLRLSRFNTAVAVKEVTHLYRLHAVGLSRVSFAKHHDALNYFFAKNAHLLDDLDPKKKQSIQAGINTLLANTAWRSVRQMAKGQLKRDTSAPAPGPFHYAKSGIAHQPLSILSPKRASHLIRALIKY